MKQNKILRSLRNWYQLHLQFKVALFFFFCKFGEGEIKGRRKPSEKKLDSRPLPPLCSTRCLPRSRPRGLFSVEGTAQGFQIFLPTQLEGCWQVQENWEICVYSGRRAILQSWYNLPAWLPMQPHPAFCPHIETSTPTLSPWGQGSHSSE